MAVCGAALGAFGAIFASSLIGNLKISATFLMRVSWSLRKCSTPSCPTSSFVTLARVAVKAGVLIAWEYVDSNGRGEILLPEQVIQTKCWNPYDEWRGLAELKSAHDAAEADYMAGKFNLNLMRQNGDQGVYVIAKNGIPDETQRQQIIDQIREKRELQQRGIYRPCFLTGDMSIEDPKIRTPDAAFISIRLENRHEVFIAFGVPPSMADVKASYSIGSASDWYMLITETCIPIGQKICGAIDRVLYNQTGKTVSANFNWDEHPVMQAVRRERADTAVKYFAIGVPLKTLNDYLNLELPPCPNWDKGYLPFNLAAIGGDDGKTPAPAPAQDPDLAEQPAPVEDAINRLKELLGPETQMRRLLTAPADSSSVQSVSSVVFQKSRPPAEIAQWSEHMAQRKPYVKKFQAAFNKALFAARVEVLAKLERHAKSIPSLQNSTTPIPRSVASDFLFNLHDFTGKLFAAVRPPTEQSFLAAGNAVMKEAGRDPWTCAPERVLQFVKQRQNMLNDVPEEIFAEIQGSIQAGIDAGDPIKTIADAVRAKFSEISSGRAKTIAITETGAAWGTARNEAMTEVGGNKKWLTSGNANVREAHADANGQVVPVDEAFSVGGEDLRYPCDPDGSPENVINCHCVSIMTSETPTQDE